MPQGDRLPGIELQSFFREAAGHEMGQGQVHIVAAHQQMIADGHAPQDQFALFFRDRDERQVGRAAAHVTDQQRIAQLERLAPLLATVGQPGVDGRLRFFQQDEIVRQARGQGRFAGQLAGRGIERGRHGEHHDLHGNRGVRMRLLPGGDHVLQVALRGGDGRDLGNTRRRAPRQDRLMAIDAAVGQPRLGRAHGAVGHFSSLPAGILAHRIVAPRGPRHVQCAALGLTGIGQVGERRQHRPRLDRAGGDKLRQGENFDLGMLGVERRPGQHAIGRAQVEAQNEAGGAIFRCCAHVSSTSIGTCSVAVGSGLLTFRKVMPWSRLPICLTGWQPVPRYAALLF
jgi:hypothetical protein